MLPRRSKLSLTMQLNHFAGTSEVWNQPAVDIPNLTSLQLRGNPCFIVLILQHLSIPARTQLDLDLRCWERTSESNLRDVVPILKSRIAEPSLSPELTIQHINICEYTGTLSLTAYSSLDGPWEASFLLRMRLRYKDPLFAVWWMDDFISYLHLPTLTSLGVNLDWIGRTYLQVLPVLAHWQDVQSLWLYGKHTMCQLLQYLQLDDVLPSLDTLHLTEAWKNDSREPKEWDDLQPDVQTFLTSGKLSQRIRSIVLLSTHLNLSDTLWSFLQSNFPNITLS
ncbi:hypothetical protein EVG20_g10708 [Dentipellis fragilis]|uniref:F-box domain-containing protein n=1 Tax=Dentipellis fragilis TaxID=205917 RepID=A0A4Y9XSD4_9AGAM|nr:hypothetical protein EVG20_g10708 [Dentipellis fragilis]